jgi:hypothetical protein
MHRDTGGNREPLRGRRSTTAAMAKTPSSRSYKLPEDETMTYGTLAVSSRTAIVAFRTTRRARKMCYQL